MCLISPVAFHISGGEGALEGTLERGEDGDSRTAPGDERSRCDIIMGVTCSNSDNGLR